MQINLKDGDYMETTKKFEVQYENMVNIKSIEINFYNYNG